ncbi:hypothetical protein HYX18_03135 [Candidatus Woesearchaeota archaeon]|nr:hypothetical protein [Candidatus Woesearchaeota archaeon]
MKRAQTEIIGLMIVVIMLVAIALVALRFVLISNSSINVDSLLSAKANNMANSIKNANLCDGNFEQAIVACCNKENFCDRESCRLISEEISSIINSSEESVYVEAIDAYGNKCFSVGNCISGIASSSYNFENEVLFRAKICRKE